MRAWVATFNRMVNEWQEVRRRRAGVLSDRWQALYEQFVERQQELRQRGQWFSGPKDLLSVIGRSRRETFHSAVLAWLLDPGAPHGLKARLLEAVLDTCFPSQQRDQRSLEGAVTECEVARRNSRADIVVWSSDVQLIFEVKVDHVERARQCDDIYKDFGHERGALFLFLTPRGREPVTATEDAREAFQTLSFRKVRTLLRGICDSVGQDGTAAPGWHTVLCYLQTLEVEFP